MLLSQVASCSGAKGQEKSTEKDKNQDILQGVWISEIWRHAFVVN